MRIQMKRSLAVYRVRRG